MSTSHLITEKAVHRTGWAQSLAEQYSTPIDYPPVQEPLRPWIGLPPEIELSKFLVERPLKLEEERVLQGALRRSVRIVRAGRLVER